MTAAAVQQAGAPPPPQQRFQGVQKESAGYKLMSAMGWREGEGLGAAKQGIKTHIKVKKKFENWGVGAVSNRLPARMWLVPCCLSCTLHLATLCVANLPSCPSAWILNAPTAFYSPLPQVEAAEHAQNWTNGMLDFHRVLSNLTEVVSEHAKRRSSDSSSSSDSGSSSDEEEDSDASGGKPPPQQTGEPAAAAGGNKKRKQASSSSSSSDESDSDSSSSEEEGEEEAVPAAPQRVRAATHLGRFKKREAGKMTKGYSEHDLAAILGADPFAAAAAAVTEVRREVSSSGYDSDSESSGDEGAQQQQKPAKAKAPVAAAAAQQPPAPPAMIVVRRPMLAYRPVAAPPTPQESRQPGWWQVCFHRAAGPGGGVGAQRADAVKPAAINVHGFSEQDQTNLYMLAHVSARGSICN
jgi:Pin2-interacting protein X1